MSEKEPSEEPLKDKVEVKVVTPNAVPKTKRKRSAEIKFLSIENFHNLKSSEVYKHIQKLHRHIRKLKRKLEKYERKIIKVKPKQTVRDEDQKPVEVTKKPEKGDDPKNFLDEIKEAAQNCQNHTDFVYEPTSGLYYDTKTGYYYNAEHGLYYDGNTGCYYSYNQDDNKFEFHSQVYAEGSTAKSVEQNKSPKRKLKESERSAAEDDEFDDDDDDEEEEEERRDRNDRRERRRQRRQRAKKYRQREQWSPSYSNSCGSDRSREDGELSDASVIEIADSSDSSDTRSSSNDQSKFEDLAKKYPPSLRVVVQETNLQKLKIGELFLITYKGGTLGREGKHDVIIPDINCSKYHLKFTYNQDTSTYTCVDLGSRNGTLLNGKRMSSAQQESDAMALVHGAVLQINRTKLLCHIHDGHTTCGHCEPGLLEVAEPVNEVPTVKPAMTKQSISKAHKDELKKLKKRYGLQDDNYTEPRTFANNRAAERRKKVGSTNEHEKTQVASTETSISTENKGFRMLAKMGWAEGNALGKNDNGLLEPIPLISNQGKKGLGCTEPVVAVDKKTAAKSMIWQKAQERYKESSEKKNQNMFAESDDSA